MLGQKLIFIDPLPVSIDHLHSSPLPFPPFPSLHAGNMREFNLVDEIERIMMYLLSYWRVSAARDVYNAAKKAGLEAYAAAAKEAAHLDQRTFIEAAVKAAGVEADRVSKKGGSVGDAATRMFTNADVLAPAHTKLSSFIIALEREIEGV